MRLLTTTLCWALLAMLVVTCPLSAQEMAGDRPPEMTSAASTPAVVDVPPAGAASAGAASDGAASGWAQKLAEGGTTVLFQVLLSIFGGAYAIERAFRLRRRAVAPLGLAAQADVFWQGGRFEELDALCRREPSTLARIIAFIVRHRESPVADVSMIAGDIASREIAQQMQRAYPLAVVATLEPLLGLLGTVLGMIESFDAIVRTGTMGDPTVLAAGISKALITTAVGLIIAIPFLGLYHYFKSRTNHYASLLEEEVTDLISEWLLRSRDEIAKGRLLEGGDYVRESAHAHQTA